MNKPLFICFFGLLVAFSTFAQDTIVNPDSVKQNEPMDSSVSQQLQISDTEVTERLNMVCKMLDRNEKGAETWWYGWLIFYGSATIGQGAVASLTGDDKFREDMILGAGTTLFGAAGQLITPVKSGYDARLFERIGQMPKELRREKLKQAEEMLKTQAAKAKRGKSWQTHAMSGVVNLSSGLITWIGFHRSVWAGIENFALNTVITEFQIWSQPTRAMKNYSQYCSKYGLTGYQKPKELDFACCAHVIPGGIGIEICF